MGCEDLFCTVLCIFATSSNYLLLLLGSYHFCPLLCPSLNEMFPWYLYFFEEISNLSHSIVFLYFFELITEENFLISPCYSLELWIQKWYIFPSILCFLLLFFSQLFVRPPQTAILPFWISFFEGWSWSLSPVQGYEPPSIVHQAFCLSDLVPYIYFSLPLYYHKGFDLSHTWMV